LANTTSVFEKAFKYTYGTNKVLYVGNQEVVLWKLLSRRKAPMGGRGQFIRPVATQNAGAWSGVTENGTIPTPLDGAFTEATFNLKEFVGSYNISWKLLQDARTDKFAFATGLQLIEDGLRRRIFRNINADLLDDGRGRLAIITGADDGAGLVTSAFLPLVEKGMVVDLMDTDNDTRHGDSLTVTAVDPIARTVQLSAAVTGEAAGDCLVIQDTLDDGETYNSLHTHGILGVVDDADPPSVVGDYGNIDRGTAGNEFWEAVVLSNSGTNRPLTEDLMLQGLDAAREKGAGKLDAIISNLAIQRRYHEMLTAERYFSLSQPGAIGGGVGRKGGQKDGASESSTGESPYEFSGIPWHTEPYFRNNTIVALDTSHFFIGTGENEVPRPVSEIWDVDTFKRGTTTSFQVEWYYQFQLLSDNPAAAVKFEDIAES
jgi:hypothetical protein